MAGVSGKLKYLILWFRIFYGAHLTYSALRYYIAYAPNGLLAAFHYHPFAPVMPPLARAFVDAITATGIYHVVKTVELIVGIALLANLFVPLALIIEMPISVVIFILNFFVVASDRQLFSGPQELLLNGLLIIFYSRYYRPLLEPVVPPLPLWASSSGTLGGEPDAGSASSLEHR
jgi:riboflavin transporter